MKGFWSYVHADDDAEGGRVSQLARDVVAQYGLLTGETIELFLDKDSLEWGDSWRAKIDDNLAAVAFFIPVMTPRYFQSAECRREFQFFARKATHIGVKELVLPLLYADVRALHDSAPEDDMVALISTFQWSDWTDLRFTERASESYRRAVAGLASRIVDANERAVEVSAASTIGATPPDSEAESNEIPGALDRLAAAEEAIPQWTATLEAVAEQVNLVGEIMTEGTADIAKADARGKGFAGRLAAAKRTSERLAPPAERIWALGNDFATQLHDVDDGIRTIIAQIEVEGPTNPGSVPEFLEFFNTIRTLASSTHDGMQSTQAFIDSIAPIEATSRDLRVPLKRLRQGVTLMLEADEVAAEWVRLMDKIELEPADPA